MHALVLLCINQHTKLEVTSFTDSKDVIGNLNLKKGQVTLTTPRLEVVCHTKAKTKAKTTCVQNFTILASDIPEISLEVPKFKMGHVTLTMPL